MYCDVPFHIQVTELVKHLSVGRQCALSENVWGLLWGKYGIIQRWFLIWVFHDTDIKLENCYFYKYLNNIYKYRQNMKSQMEFVLPINRRFTGLQLERDWGCVSTGARTLLSRKFHQTSWLWNWRKTKRTTWYFNMLSLCLENII